MSNIFDDMHAAVDDANTILKAADSVATDMACLLVGRLRHVSPYRLIQLKRELQQFDAHKKEWKL